MGSGLASVTRSEVYGDTAQFTKEGDKFTALLLGFPLWKLKGTRQRSHVGGSFSVYKGLGLSGIPRLKG